MRYVSWHKHMSVMKTYAVKGGQTGHKGGQTGPWGRFAMHRDWHVDRVPVVLMGQIQTACDIK